MRQKDTNTCTPACKHTTLFRAAAHRDTSLVINHVDRPFLSLSGGVLGVITLQLFLIAHIYYTPQLGVDVGP